MLEFGASERLPSFPGRATVPIMPSTVTAPSPTLFAVLAFNASNQLAVRRLGSKLGLAFTGSDLAMATTRLESCFHEHTQPAEYFSSEAGGRVYRVLFVQ